MTNQLDRLRQDLRDYMTADERPATYVADKIGVSGSLLHKFLEGIRGLSEQNQEKLKSFLEGKKNER